MDNDNRDERDAVERDAADLAEAGRDLGQARERQLAVEAEAADIQRQIADLNERQDALLREKQALAGRELADEERAAEDVRDLEARLKGGGGDTPPASGLVTININTDDFQEPQGRITYDRLVQLAYPDFAKFPDATYSILYERGPKSNPQGTISKGGSVEICEGMRFRVKRTGES